MDRMMHKRRLIDLHTLAARFLVCLCVGVICASAQGAASDASTRFFKTHPNAFDAVEQGDRILFANRQVGLEFRKSATGFELMRLYGIAEDQDFLTAAADGKPRDLYEIWMALDPKFVGKDDRGSTRQVKIGAILNRMEEMGKAFAIGSQSGKTVSWSCERSDQQSVLRLAWKGIDAQNQKGVLDAEVTITLRDGDPLSYWRIAVRNRSPRFGIARVRLPILSLAQIGETKKNVFIFPKWRGGYIEDPFNAPAGLGENYHKVGAYYPYYTNMQFWALYNRETSKGLYVATQDPGPSMTHVAVNNTPTEIAWSISHFPSNISFITEDFALPYDCVVGPFRGDWYDAAQIYRAWAIKQSWCGKGPLASRKDIPTWYKEAPLFFYSMTNDSATGTHSHEENLQLAAEHFKEWLKWAGLRLPMNLYSWHVYDPALTVSSMPFQLRRPTNAPRWAGLHATYEPSGNYPRIPALPELSRACKSLRDAGGMVCPYVCLQLFDQGPTENAPFTTEAKPHMSRDMYGAMQTYPGMDTWLPCVAEGWWQKRLADECVALLDRENVGGVYLDVMRGTGLPCFWTPHGHPASGGRTMTDGMHALSGAIRDAMKAKDPEAITTGEDSTENMIDVIDGVLYQRTLRPENKVPLFGVVYNDYIPRYGLELSVSRPKDFFIECSSLFVEGAQIGRLRLRPRDNVVPEPGSQRNARLPRPDRRLLQARLGQEVFSLRATAAAPGVRLTIADAAGHPRRPGRRRHDGYRRRPCQSGGAAVSGIDERRVSGAGRGAGRVLGKCERYRDRVQGRSGPCAVRPSRRRGDRRGEGDVGGNFKQDARRKQRKRAIERFAACAWTDLVPPQACFEMRWEQWTRMYNQAFGLTALRDVE